MPTKRAGALAWLLLAAADCVESSALQLPKHAVSDDQRFLFVAGVEGCGHHFWAEAFKTVFAEMPEVQSVPWGGQAARLSAWARCSSHGSGALDASVSTCLNLVAEGSDAHEIPGEPIFSEGQDRAQALASAYSASLKVVQAQQFKLSSARSLQAIGSSRLHGRAPQQRDRIGRGEVPVRHRNSTAASSRPAHPHAPTGRTAHMRRGGLGQLGGMGSLKRNATMSLSLVGDMTQSYPFGTIATSPHFLPYVDVDAWAAESAGADYRILVLRRDPEKILQSNICHSHYHRNKYTHSVDRDAQYPALGYWGGDEAKAVDFYIDVLSYAYTSLEKQLALLDHRFYMPVTYEHISSHDSEYVDRLLHFILPKGLEGSPDTNGAMSDFVRRFDDALNRTAGLKRSPYDDTMWQASLRLGSRPGVIPASQAEEFHCAEHVLQRPTAVAFMEYVNAHPLAAK